jgi:hypothetical protein
MYVDLSGNQIDERLMLELDSINSSRSIRGITSALSRKPSRRVLEESDSESAKRSAANISRASSSRKSGSRSASDTSESAMSKSKHSRSSERRRVRKIV